MRIAMVTATFPPYRAGTGTVVYHNARVMHERGHDVEVFTAEFDGRTPMAYPVPVHFLGAVYRIGNAPLTPSLLRRLRGFDVIHLHYPYIFGADLVEVASRLYGIPVVLTYHNRLVQSGAGVKSMLFHLYNAWREPAVLRRSRRVIGVSADHLQSVPGMNRYADKTTEVANGVDVRLFCPGDRAEARRSLGLLIDARIVLFVGALDAAHQFKNVPGLLRAFAPLADEAMLLIAGDGDLRPALEMQAGASVRFLGSQGPEALAVLYRAANVTVLPSTEVESFGIVLVESMACATPVIATRLPGVQTVVDAPHTGLLVPPGDDLALEAAMAQMLRDPARARAMGLAGRDRALRLYDWDAIGARLERVYQDAANRD